MIKKIQNDAGVRIQFKQGRSMEKLWFTSVSVQPMLSSKNCLTQIPICPTDDGSGPDKIAHISGPPERCEHAAQIINDLLQSIRVREEGQGVGNSLSHRCINCLTG